VDKIDTNNDKIHLSGLNQMLWIFSALYQNIEKHLNTSKKRQYLVFKRID